MDNTMQEVEENTLPEMEENTLPENEQNEKRTVEQKEKTKKAILEIIVVVMLGMSAILTAWATWMGSLHSGIQNYNFTVGNYLASRGTAEYNAAIQTYMQDMLLFNEVDSLILEQYFAEQRNDEEELEVLEWKINHLMYGNMRTELADAVEWSIEEADIQGEFISPFDMEGFADSYYETSFATLAEAEDAIAKGDEDGANADSFGLVTVIYAVVMFLLGITGTLASYKNRIAIVCIACIAFVIATVYMFTIPLPSGFSIMNFFSGS